MNISKLGFKNTHKTLDNVARIIEVLGWLSIGVCLLVAVFTLGSGNGSSLAALIIAGGGIVGGGVLIVNAQLAKAIGLIERNTQIAALASYEQLSRLTDWDDTSNKQEHKPQTAFEAWLQKVEEINPSAVEKYDRSVLKSMFSDGISPKYVK